MIHKILRVIVVIKRQFLWKLEACDAVHMFPRGGAANGLCEFILEDYVFSSDIGEGNLQAQYLECKTVRPSVGLLFAHNIWRGLH